MTQKEDGFLKFFFLASFGIFGLTALIFQAVFAKALMLLFGLTAPAIATVLAVYFSGLGLGGLIFGRLADRFSQPPADKKIYRLYTAFFALTAVYGFLFPLIFKLLNKTILAINRLQPLNFSGFNFFAFIFSFIFLIFPAILIGGGFPVINKIIIGQAGKLGKRLSLIYFLETFGSAMGAALAGFWLIPAVGNNATIFSAAGLNLIIAGLLWLFYKSPKFEQSNAETARLEKNPTPEEIQPKKAGNSVFFYALFLTGFLALALEVLYTKTLILFIGSSTYAFSLILIVFLLGLALGSLAISPFLDKIKKGSAYFGMFLGLLGFWLFLTVQFFERLPFWYLNIFKTFKSFAFTSVFSAQLILTALIIFPATFLMGIIFPLGIKLAKPDVKKLGQGIGKLYFANTFGGVLGSLIAGFLLLPSIGFQKTLVLILSAYLLTGAVFIWREKTADVPIRAGLVVFLIFWSVFAVFTSPWSSGILSAGAFLYAPNYLKSSEAINKKGMQSQEILFYKEGLSQVAVMKNGNDIALRVNGKTDASTNAQDLEPEILIGALPMLLHKNPKTVLAIGLGAGISLGAITRFDEAEQVDAVEIDPAIVAAARYFKEYNNNALNDPRVKIILADAKNYLYLNDKKYDVISAEPSNLWVSGNANLFTKEFYESAKAHLNKNGLMLQWVHSYYLEPDDLKIVFKTFQEVFPKTYLFNTVGGTDFLLVGSLSEDSILNYDLIDQKLKNPKVADELERIYITNPYEVLAYAAAGPNSLKIYSKNAKFHTDNQPILEFSSPRAIYKSTADLSLRDIFDLRGKLSGDLLIGGDKEKFKDYLAAYQKIIPLVISLRKDDLNDSLEFYKDIQKTGIINPIIQSKLVNLCHRKTEAIRRQAGDEAAEKEWQKCEFIFNEVSIQPAQ